MPLHCHKNTDKYNYKYNHKDTISATITTTITTIKKKNNDNEMTVIIFHFNLRKKSQNC